MWPLCVCVYKLVDVCCKVAPSGMLILTDEEKRTFIAEGYPVPTRWPLSKQDEKNLKKVQRKIKNKVDTSVVTTIEISPPPRWLATTEPTPPPRCFTVFSAVFLGTVYCASVFCSAACRDSHHSSNAASFDLVWNVNARRVGDTACPPPTRPLPNSRDSISTTVQLCCAGPAMLRGLRSSHLLLCGRRRSHASKSSAQPCWPRRSQSTGLTVDYVNCLQASAMIDITQVVFLSVCQELRS